MAKKVHAEEPAIRLYSITGRPESWVRHFDAKWLRGAGQPPRILRGVVAVVEAKAGPRLAVYTDRIEPTHGACTDTEYPGSDEVLRDDGLVLKLVQDSLAQVAAQRSS